MRPALVLLLACFAPVLAHAGAWPRERGTGFLSISQEVHRRPGGGFSSYQSLYLEYGATDRLTLGVTADRRDDGTYVDLMPFARIPLTPAESESKLAVQLAIGGRRTAAGREVMVQPGIHWGLGFAAPEAFPAAGPGWMGIESSFGLGLSSGDYRIKTDFTLGFTPRDDTHLIFQVQTQHTRAGTTVKLVPSYVARVNRVMQIEVGLTWLLSGDNRLGLKAGSWIEF